MFTGGQDPSVGGVVWEQQRWAPLSVMLDAGKVTVIDGHPSWT